MTHFYDSYSMTHLFAMSYHTVRIYELTRTETAFINLLPNSRVCHSLTILVSVCHVIMFGIMFASCTNYLNVQSYVGLIVRRTIWSHCPFLICSWCRNFGIERKHFAMFAKKFAQKIVRSRYCKNCSLGFYSLIIKMIRFYSSQFFHGDRAQ